MAHAFIAASALVMTLAFVTIVTCVSFIFETMTLVKVGGKGAL